MSYRMPVSRLLMVSLLGVMVLSSCKSLDIFVKDPTEQEISNLEPAGGSSRYVSINDPARAPSPTIICSKDKQSQIGSRTIVRSECVDMDGVYEGNVSSLPTE